VYASSSSALATGSALTFNGTNEFKVLAATGVAYNRTESTQYSTFAQHFAASGNTGVEYKTAYRFVDTDVGEIGRFTSTGLGIGTSSPSYKLEVRNDSATAYNPSTVAFNTILSINNQSNGASKNALMAFSTESNGEWYIGGVQNAGNTAADFVWASRASGARAERARITSDGNLGLGVTPSAWGSGERAIQLAGTTFGNGVFSSSNNTAVIVGANAYYSSTGYKRIVAAASSIIQFAVGETRFLTAASSTADSAISFTQAMTLDASSRLLVGTTTLGVGGNSNVALSLANGNSSIYQSIRASGGEELYLYAASGSTGIYAYSNSPLTFGTNNTERARITSDGVLLVGKTVTTLADAGSAIYGAGYGQFTASGDASLFTNRLASDGDTVKFYRQTSLVGSISVTTTATAYNTSSDYRLKNTIAPMTGALAKVALLKPCTYKWNVNGSDGEGFIAHELAEVVPHAVTGEKDAVDADGKPQYQGIDVSFLVATLTAAIQEQQAIIESLKARLDAANL
jgi:hypothetical protein